MVVDVEGVVGAAAEGSLHGEVVTVGGPGVVRRAVGAAEGEADGGVGVGVGEVGELRGDYRVGDVSEGAGQGGGAVCYHVDVGVDCVEATGCLAGGVLGVRLGREACTVVEEHGGIPEGVVDGFMLVEVLVLGSQFGARACDRAVAEGEVVDR